MANRLKQRQATHNRLLAVSHPLRAEIFRLLAAVRNSYVAARMWGSQPNHFGPGGTWHGSSHVTNTDAHYRGHFDLRRVLGGLTFAQAIDAVSPGSC